MPNLWLKENFPKIEPEQLAAVLPLCWTRETCFPTDQKLWTPEEPWFGQCGVTAMTVHLLVAEFPIIACTVHKTARVQGRAYFNVSNDSLRSRDFSRQGSDAIKGKTDLRTFQSLFHGHTAERFALLFTSVKRELGIPD